MKQEISSCKSFRCVDDLQLASKIKKDCEVDDFIHQTVRCGNQMHFLSNNALVNNNTFD